jgi:type IX secretion system PorP/SprF family membrane protein
MKSSLHIVLKRITIAFVAVFLLWNVRSATAQDVHFTQFYHNPLLLNPAQAGLACNWRAGLNYRNQWASVTVPYVTFAAYFDCPIYFNSRRNSSLGVGLGIYDDRAGDGNLNTIEINPTIAFHYGFRAAPKRYKFSIGVQPSIRNRSVDITKLTFAAQYDPNLGEINTNLSQNEPTLTNQKYTVFDLNTGVQFSAAPTDEINFWVGASAFHLLGPNESFYSNQEISLPIREMINAGARFILNDNWTILTNELLFQQASAKELDFGGDFDYTVNPRDAKPFTIFAGPYYRWNDAMQILFGGEYMGFRVGMTYDLNTSSLHTASHFKGGMELAIMYKADCRLIPYHINKLFVCPRF